MSERKYNKDITAVNMIIIAVPLDEVDDNDDAL